MKKFSQAVVLLSFVVMLSACADVQGQNVYAETELGKQSNIDFGKILAVRHVKIKTEDSGVGTIGGATAGGLAGANVGEGNGQIAGVVAGALLGGIIGNAAEQSLMKKVGVEYVIRKDNGKTVSIVQAIARDDTPLSVGQRVMIQTSGEYQKVANKSQSMQFQRVLPVDDSIDPKKK